MKASLLRVVFAVAAQVLFAAGSGIAWASDKVVEKPVTADTPEKFAQTVEQIHKEMSAGGRYEFLRPDNKAKVDADLNSMAEMLKKSGSVAAMSQDEKVQLFNTQEHVNGILTHSDRNRLVCDNTASTGSNLRRTTCMTVGEIEIKRQHDQKGIQDLQKQANQNNCSVKIKGQCAGG